MRSTKNTAMPDPDSPSVPQVSARFYAQPLSRAHAHSRWNTASAAHTHTLKQTVHLHLNLSPTHQPPIIRFHIIIHISTYIIGDKIIHYIFNFKRYMSNKFSSPWIDRRVFLLLVINMTDWSIVQRVRCFRCPRLRKTVLAEVSNVLVLLPLLPATNRP